MRRTIQYKRFVYETDSQTGFYSMMGMKGNVTTSPPVKELRVLWAVLRVLFIEQNIEVKVVWRPREDEHQQLADFWSKVQDNTGWSLRPAVYQESMQHKILQGLTPSLDVFGSHATAKVPQVLYSKCACLRTSGVDASIRPWAYDLKTGVKHLA